MKNAHIFRERIKSGKPVIATAVTLTDPIVSEILSQVADAIWIDAEHNPLTSKVVEGHLMAVQARKCPVIVRVPMGDVNFIKHALDGGADGIIGPQSHTADDVRRVVHACRYPPLGTRGFGPRRAVDYGASAGNNYPGRANQEVLAFVMIEDINAVNQLDEILDIPGLDGLVIGPADLSASLGVIGNIGHPDVQHAIDTIIEKTRRKGLIIGVGGGDDVETARRWFARGVQWMQMGGDCPYLLNYARRMIAAVREGSP